MNSIFDKVKGNWKLVQSELKQKFAELTDDDLKLIEGREEELLGRIQKKTGKTKEEIKDFIDNI